MLRHVLVALMLSYLIGEMIEWLLFSQIHATVYEEATQ